MASPESLAQAGEALYGQQWQSALARDLGVSDRTMRRWAAGDTALPVTLGAALRGLLQARASRLQALAKQVGRVSA